MGNTCQIISKGCNYLVKDCCKEDGGYYDVKSGTCINDLSNKIYIITPAGEKVLIETCEGIMLDSGLCVMDTCENEYDDDGKLIKEYVFIDGACEILEDCDAEVYNGICMNSCAMDEFYDRNA